MNDTTTTLDLRRSDDRGQTRLGWLASRHSFSFGGFRDEQRMGFGPLRVLNDDIVAGGGGFGEHGHDNMEIITWVLSGALEHADSTGTRGVIQPGDVQVMSAGAGVRHSEMNASADASAHFLQVWIEPAERGTPPGYAHKHFAQPGRAGRWQVLVSPDGRAGSLAIRQDAALSVADLGPGQSVDAALPAGRRGYLHVASGDVAVNEQSLTGGDAIAITGAAHLHITSNDASQVLWFELP